MMINNDNNCLRSLFTSTRGTYSTSGVAAGTAPAPALQHPPCRTTPGRTEPGQEKGARAPAVPLQPPGKSEGELPRVEGGGEGAAKCQTQPR